MATFFTLSVEEDLTKEQAEKIISDLEEVLAKHNLSLDDSIQTYIHGDEWEENIGSDPSCGE